MCFFKHSFHAHSVHITQAWVIELCILSTTVFVIFVRDDSLYIGNFFNAILFPYLTIVVTSSVFTGGNNNKGPKIPGEYACKNLHPSVVSGDILD